LKHYIFIFKHVNAKEEKTNPDKKNPRKISISFLPDLILKLFIYIVEQIFFRVEPLTPFLLINEKKTPFFITHSLSTPLFLLIVKPPKSIVAVPIWIS